MTQKTKERIKKNAEVFTPPTLVRELVEATPDEAFAPDKTALDPACGSGNLLLGVLWKKLMHGSTTLQALSTIYGTDIMPDNVLHTRLRLLTIASAYEPVTQAHVEAVLKNIVWLKQDDYPDGSLDYDFSFRTTPDVDDVTTWLAWFQRTPDLPVKPEKDIKEPFA